MTESRKGKESPEIALHKGEARAVEDTDDCERDQEWGDRRAWAGKRPTWKRSIE